MGHHTTLLSVALLAAALQSAAALVIIACNCSQPTVIGAMSLKEITQCNEPATIKAPIKVRYAIVSTKVPTKTFTGFSCSRIRRELEVTGNFWIGSYSKDRMNYDEYVSPEECWTMKQTKRCGDHKMAQQISEASWSFSELPDGPGYWNSDVIYTKINCYLEQITLRKECDTCPIISPYGKVGNVSDGSFVLNHMTIVWEDNKATQHNCTLSPVAQGTGDVYETEGPLPLRLKDRTHQLDFLLSSPKPSPCPGQFMFEASEVREVDNSKTLFAIISSNSSVYGLKDSKNTRFTDAEIEKNAGIFQKKFGAHLQSIEDEAIERENLLADEINDLDCKIKENIKNNIVSIAQGNGITAGRMLKLPVCQTVQASLTSVVILQCAKLTINVTAEKSPCGYQPKYDNYSIALDGWRLTPFSSCTWTTPYVNLNDILHRYENETWVPIQTNIRLPHHKLVTAFNFTVDEAVKWVPQKLDIDYATLEHSHMLADMVSVLKENKINRLSDLTKFSFDKKWIDGIAEWSPFTIVSTWFWRIIYIIMAIVSVYVTYKLWQMTGGCKCCQRRQVDNTSLIPLQVIGPPSGAVQGQRIRQSRQVRHNFSDEEFQEV